MSPIRQRLLNIHRGPWIWAIGLAIGIGIGAVAAVELAGSGHAVLAGR